MAQSNRKFYRDNGAAAYDVYAWNDQAARQYEDGRAYERSRQYAHGLLLYRIFAVLSSPDFYTVQFSNDLFYFGSASL